MLCVNQIMGFAGGGEKEAAAGGLGLVQVRISAAPAVCLLCISAAPPLRLPLHLGPVQGKEADGSQLAAGLGMVWAHCVNTRLVLQYAAGAACAPPAPHTAHAPPLFGAAARAMELRVAKSPVSPEATFGYAVDERGLGSRALPPGWAEE